MYADGRGVAKAPDLALYWYKVAARAGDAEAWSKLGTLYWNSKDIPPDYQAAIDAYRAAAAAAGDVDIDNVYGIIGDIFAAGGHGVARNYATALYWFKREQAYSRIADLYYTGGPGLNKNYSLALRWYRKSSAYDPWGANMVGNMYLDGQGVRRNFASAMQSYLAAIGNRNSVVDNGRGELQEYLSSSPSHWERFPEDDRVANAEKNIASLYELGKGVRRNYETALYWYQIAGSETDAKRIESKLGTRGTAVVDRKHAIIDENQSPPDYASALQWFRLAANLGDPAAENDIGSMYERGLGVSHNFVLARKWYLRSAAHGYAIAPGNIAQMYEAGEGVAKNLASAISWYKIGASRGDALAANNLGVAYERELRYVEAAHWYTLAAAKGQVRSEFHLGHLYEHGLGVERNVAAALHWYRVASAHGDADAEYAIGLMYERGVGVVKGFTEALSWYRRAARRTEDTPGGKPRAGVGAAELRIGTLYEFGRGVAIDDAAALKWYTRAAAHGSEEAKTSLRRVQLRLNRPESQSSSPGKG